jgi:hypothetical protein
MKKTITNLNGETERVSLPRPIWEGARNHGTGISLCAVFVGPRTGRVIVETNSIWEDRGNPGCCVGYRYHEADDEECAQLAAMDEDVGAAIDAIRNVTEL